MKKYYLYFGLFIFFVFSIFFSSLSFLKLESIEFSFENVELAVLVDGVVQTSIPKKDSGKAVESIVCDKNAVGLWNYEDWTINIKNMTESRVKCNLSFVSKYSEPILNGTDPVLKEGLIPVMIDNDGVVKKASLGREWYRYENKSWANAVILNDNRIAYAEGEVIPESNIESYFVWIPRFKYQIFNEGNYETQTGTLTDNKLPSKAQEIKIVFEQNTVAKSNGTAVGQWLTHPAFTSFDVNGIWVGKFETGYKGSNDVNDSRINANEPASVQIKPNVSSWVGIQPVNIYFTSYGYRRDYNSHMMKNTEWGAVAYLQHSKYGSMSSVRINNNSNFLTGYSAVVEPTCGYTGASDACNRYGTSEDITKPWNTSVGYLASTTGNISGIYDMAGGAWEYMMSVMLDKEGRPMSGRNRINNSGFNGTFGCPTCDSDTSGQTELTDGVSFPSDTRYYDTYLYSSTDENYQRRILGDATGEVGPFATATYGTQNRQIGSWYDDTAFLNVNWSPWIKRGGGNGHGIDAGIFAFDGVYGALGHGTGFRIVLGM